MTKSLRLTKSIAVTPEVHSKLTKITGKDMEYNTIINILVDYYIMNNKGTEIE